MTQRRRRIRFALPAMALGGLIEPGLTSGLARPKCAARTLSEHMAGIGIVMDGRMPELHQGMSQPAAPITFRN
jgi:hypothetical protein